MADHQIVSSEEWLQKRRALLEKEKEFTRLRDEMSRQIRELPWERVEKDYVFDGPDGSESLSDLFDGRSQLLVYHFMFGPDATEGCPACSLVADHYDPLATHLEQRDVTLVTISRAPLAKLQAYQERMGWTFKWVSSQGSDFNFDYRVSFQPEDVESRNIEYNYGKGNAFQMSDLQGLSVFAKNESGEVFHTYSTYARGLDTYLGVYRFLDIVPKGRDEGELPFSMSWVQRHDCYQG
jgi:predicted dithiol-disulfide oxidoreductase (DUF899 family)